MQIVGFWPRALACTIDAILIGMALFAVEFAAGGAIYHTTSYGTPYEGAGAAVNLTPPGAIVALLGGWLYFALMESSVSQATVGKMAIGARVTDLYGNRISFARATGRYFAKILSAGILFIGCVMVAFTSRKQGLHDMVAGSLVLNRGDMPAGVRVPMASVSTLATDPAEQRPEVANA